MRNATNSDNGFGLDASIAQSRPHHYIEPTMSHDSSQIEVDALVADNFSMWAMDLRGEKYHKAEHNRRLRQLSPNRNRSAVKQRHRNISTVLWHLGYPSLCGYKPLPRYQNLLRSLVEGRLAIDSNLNRLVTVAVTDPASIAPLAKDVGPIQVTAPRGREMKELMEDETYRRTHFAPRNYLEVEANNHSLGLADEEFILQYKRERLSRAGKRKLAERVEHVALPKGDFLGFDIVSFELAGRERLIEVKTARYGAMTRFFASMNELEISQSHNEVYHLHRLFNFGKKPQFFVLSGSLGESCQLKPIRFSAIPT